MRNRILIKGCQPLYVESLQTDITDPQSKVDDLMTELSHQIRQWVIRGIHDIYLFTSQDRIPDRTLIDKLTQMGYNLFILPQDRYRNNDFLFVEKMAALIRRRLKNSAAQLLFKPTESFDTSFLLSSLLLSRKTAMSATRANQFITGEASALRPEHRLVLYNEYLQGLITSSSLSDRFVIPVAPLKKVEAPSPTSGLIESSDSELSSSLIKEETSPIPFHGEAIEQMDLDLDLSLIENFPPDANVQPSPSSSESKRSAFDPGVPAAAESMKKSETGEVTPAQTKPSNAQTASYSTGPAPSSGLKFSIKSKLITITSTIILFSMSGMIFLASYFFKQDSEARVQESNLALTEAIAQKMELEYQTLIFRSRLIARARIGQNYGRTSGNFFQENQDIVFVGLALPGENGAGYRIVDRLYNYGHMAELNLSEETLNNLLKINENRFTVAAGGATSIQNISPGSPIPLHAIATPVEKNTSGRFLIVVIDPRTILGSFRSSGLITTFMVNNSGEVIAHPDSRLLVTRTSFQNLEIVEKLLESKLDNGQIVFTDPSGVVLMGSFKKINLSSLGIISTVPRDKAFAAVYSIQRRNMIIMGIMVLLAVLIIFFFGRALTIPIVRLVGATKKIESGDYHVDIRSTSGDEVGILTESFVNMARGLEEREKMKDAFGKFVNKEIAEKVLRGEIKLGGEKKHAAIFFSDLRNFTAMSEKMTPEGVVELLNEYFTEMVGCINQSHGVVDKFIGDAIMAHWGAVISQGNDTENAVNSALQMRKALIEINNNASRKNGEKPKLMFGCGINTGHVISGQIGSEERLEFTVIGDAVNLASRIESLNKPFHTDILISQDALNQVMDIFKVEPMPAIRVKGKSEPQMIYAVVGRNDDPDCPANLNEVRAMVGISMDEKTMQQLKSNVLEEDKEEKYEILEK